jgi:hypothetical protein
LLKNKEQAWVTFLHSPKFDPKFDIDKQALAFGDRSWPPLPSIQVPENFSGITENQSQKCDPQKPSIFSVLG